MATTWNQGMTNAQGYGDTRTATRNRPAARGDFARGVNIGDRERMISVIAGGGMLVYGLARGPLRGWLPALAGAVLAWRGLTGVCNVYQLLGINRTVDDETVAGNLGIKVDRSIVVEAPPERLYAVWRNLEKLPRVMSHLAKVEVLDRTRSRWTIALAGGLSISWEAEIINDIPNELIAWRSLAGGMVRHAGSVRFERAPDGRATVVRVSLQYDPPAGQLGHAIAGLLGENADAQIANDLIEFKRAIEAGELAA